MPKNRHSSFSGARNASDTKRVFCTALNFWTACERKGCRRARACAGDGEACFARFWPHVPEETKLRLRAGAAARGEGLPLSAVAERIEAEVERFRASRPVDGLSA